MCKKEKQIAVKITQEEFDQMDKYSKETGISKTALINQALKLRLPKKGNAK